MVAKKVKNVCYYFQRIIDLVGDDGGEFPHGRVVHGILKGHFALMQRFLRFLALGYFSIECLSLLLKLADVAQPVSFIVQRRVTFDGDYRGVFRANFL